VRIAIEGPEKKFVDFNQFLVVLVTRYEKTDCCDKVFK